MVLGEDSELCTLGGSFTDELRGAMKVRGGVEGLQATRNSQLNHRFGKVGSFKKQTSGASCIKATLKIGSMTAPAPEQDSC